MAIIQLSRGLLVINERDELLIGFTHRQSPLGSPKAHRRRRNPLARASGEGREEFDLGYGADRPVDPRRHAYYRGNDLHLFAVGTTTRETAVERCSWVRAISSLGSGGRPVPEIDRFAWADDD